MSKKGRLLLTGGRGMVGRNILEHTASADWEIVAPRHNELDLTDSAAVHDFFRNFKPDVVIHAAGRVGGIQANIAAPVDFLVVNLDIGRNVILAARDAGVQRLLNLGSSCMYPRSAPNPLVEEMVLQGELEPTNEGYALAKIVAARLCDYIRREQPVLQYKTMIPCNLYGRYDKFDPLNSHLVPAVIHKIHTAQQSLDQVVEIWGDGMARREFMYGRDFADAVFYALDHFDSMPDTINIGLGRDYSINEYYSAIAEVIGWNGSFQHDLSKPVGMQQKLVSIERQKAWGWQPRISLSQGIRETYQYYLGSIFK